MLAILLGLRAADLLFDSIHSADFPCPELNLLDCTLLKFCTWHTIRACLSSTVTVSTRCYKAGLVVERHNLEILLPEACASSIVDSMSCIYFSEGQGMTSAEHTPSRRRLSSSSRNRSTSRWACRAACCRCCCASAELGCTDCFRAGACSEYA